MKNVLLILVLILGFLMFSGNINTDCYPPYKTLKNYSVNSSTTYQFTINNDKGTFAVVDKQCSVIKDDTSEDIFENYFTLQYADVINSTPKEIRDIKDATDIIVSLTEKPFKMVESQEINKLSENLSSFMKSIKTVDKINIISSEYNTLYRYVDTSLIDNELSKSEVDEVQKRTSRFIFVFLDETNQVQNFVNEFVDNKLITYLFKADNWLKGIELYKNKRDSFMTEQIRRILFDVPIDFIYQNLNE